MQQPQMHNPNSNVFAFVNTDLFSTSLSLLLDLQPLCHLAVLISPMGCLVHG